MALGSQLQYRPIWFCFHWLIIVIITSIIAIIIITGIIIIIVIFTTIIAIIIITSISRSNIPGFLIVSLLAPSGKVHFCWWMEFCCCALLHYSALLLCCALCAVMCCALCSCVLCVLLCCAALLTALLLCAVWSFSSQSLSPSPGGSAALLVDWIQDFRPDTKNRVLPAVYISDEIDNEMKGEVKFCWWIPNQHCWPSPTFNVYLTHLLQYHAKTQIYKYLTILCPIMQ